MVRFEEEQKANEISLPVDLLQACSTPLGTSTEDWAASVKPRRRDIALFALG